MYVFTWNQRYIHNIWRTCWWTLVPCSSLILAAKSWFCDLSNGWSLFTYRTPIPLIGFLAARRQVIKVFFFFSGSCSTLTGCCWGCIRLSCSSEKTLFLYYYENFRVPCLHVCNTLSFL